MPIYKGSAKIGTVYRGGTKIGLVYKGSTLVYSGAKNIPIYYSGDFSSSKFYSFGYPTADSTLVVQGGDNLSNILPSIENITGNIGTSGSTITLKYSGGTQSATFQTSFTDSYGNLFYRYAYDTFGLELYAFVSPKVNIGDNAIGGFVEYGQVSSDGKTLTYRHWHNKSKSFAITNHTIVGDYLYKK